MSPTVSFLGCSDFQLQNATCIFRTFLIPLEYYESFVCLNLILLSTTIRAYFVLGSFNRVIIIIIFMPQVVKIPGVKN